MDLNVGSVVANLRLDSKKFAIGLMDAQRKFERALTTMANFAVRFGSKLAKVFSTAFSKITKVIEKWVKRAAIAFAAYTTASLKAFSSFEDAIVRSAAVTVKANRAMQREMQQTALQMSTKSILSARELAEGYFALGQAGFTAAQSIKALPVVQDFAIASQVKLDTATRYLVRTLEGLGMASEDPIRNMRAMEQVSNSFTFAAIKTTAEIQDFAVAMTHAAAPALRLVNKSMEEGTAVLMAFARAGIVAEEAGTLLWTTVRDLQRANIKARGEWEKLNIHIYDANGNMRNLADIFGDLEKKFSGMSDQGKKVNLMLLGFQDRSLRGIQALMGFSDQMKKFETEMRQLNNLTKEIAEKYMKSFRASMIMLWHQVVKISIAFGQRLAPAIRGLSKDFDSSRDIIEKWVVAVGDKMAYAIEHVRKFVRYVRYDMGNGIQVGLDIVKVVFKKFGHSLAIILEEIFVKLGANVFVWFQRGFAKRLELNKVSDEMLNKAMGVKSNWERYFKLLMMDKGGLREYTEEAERAQREAMERLSTGYFKTISEKAYPTIPIDFSTVEGALENIVAEGKAEIDAILSKSTYAEFTKTMPEIKEQWKTLFATLKRDTEDFADYGSEIVLKRFRGIKEQLKTMDIANIIFPKEKIQQTADIAIDRWGQFIKETMDMTERFKDFSMGAFNTIADAVSDAFAGIEVDWKATVRVILQELQRMVLKFLMAKALVSVGLGGLVPSSMGNAFSKGKVIPMQMGGVISSPTFIPVNRNETAYIAEAGPEAVMPLSRTKSGELGVKAEQPNIMVEPKIKINNLFDKSEMIGAMDSSEGEKVIINVMRRRGLI